MNKTSVKINTYNNLNILIVKCQLKYDRKNCLLTVFHVTERSCLPPYPKSVCPSVGPQLFLFMSHALFLFSLNRSISSPFRRVLSLLAFGNTISRAHIYMLTLFTIYSFAVFQIDLLYALRYCSLQQNGFCYFHFKQYSGIQSWFKTFLFWSMHLSDLQGSPYCNLEIKYK